MKWIKFHSTPPTFEYTISAIFGPPDITKFNQLNLNPQLKKIHRGDDYDTYQFILTQPEDVYKAGIISLESEIYENDSTFSDYAHKLLELEASVTHEEAHQRFSGILNKKYNELLRVQRELQALALSVGISPQDSFVSLNSSSHKTLVAEIDRIVASNRQLYDAIVQKSREKAEEYNDSASHAIIMAISSSYLQTYHQGLMSDAHSAYQQHHTTTVPSSEKTPLNSDKPSDIPSLPNPEKVYPYIESDLEFPDLQTVKSISHLSVKTSDVQELSSKIKRLSLNQKVCKEDLSGFTYFFGVIKKFFGAIYNGLLEALGKSQHPSELAKNVDNIVNGVDVSERAKKLHRYNSRTSPLISVIHDPNLSETEKLDLLDKLAKATPYRFPHEPKQTLSNIEINGGEPDSSNPKVLESIWERSPLQHAVEFGTLDQMNVLLQHGASLETKGSNLSIKQGTALHMAVNKGDVQKVQKLISAGADVNARDDNGNTPLHFAKSKEMAELLLTSNAQLNASNNDGNTALHMAARHNLEPVASHLLTQPAIEVDARNKLGNTALHIASHFGISTNRATWCSFSSTQHSDSREANLKIMSALVENGAKVNAVNKYGYTPLLLVVNMEKNALGTSWANTGETDLSFMQRKVEFLCAKGADVNHMVTADNDNKFDSERFYNDPSPTATPLLALYGRPSFSSPKDKDDEKTMRMNVAKTLVRYGANPQILRGKDKKSLLYLCARKGDAVGLEYFLNLGLDPNYQASPSTSSPLQVVLSWQSSFYSYDGCGKACIDTLLKHGADPTTKLLMKITVSSKTLNGQYRGIYLGDIIIRTIFEHDNVFSQKAKAQGRVIGDPTFDINQQRKILADVLKENGDHDIELTIPVYPEIFSTYHGGFNNHLGISAKAMHYMDQCRTQYLEQSPRTLIMAC